MLEADTVTARVDIAEVKQTAADEPLPVPSASEAPDPPSAPPAPAAERDALYVPPVERDALYEAPTPPAPDPPQPAAAEPAAGLDPPTAAYEPPAPPPYEPPVARPAPEPAYTPPPLPPLPATADEAVRIALANNPDLVAITRQARAAGYDVRVAQAGRLPTLSAVASGTYLNDLGGAAGPNSGTQSAAGLNARIPLFQGGLPGARTRQAQALELDDVPPTAHPYPLKNVLRPDVVSASVDTAEVLAAAPAVEDGRFRVPPILGEAP